jgi:predicted cupin superfamily sugar epimerase
MHTAQEVIQKLNLSPHPEKGWYIQTFEDADKTNNRSHSTAIYYLLEKGVVSHWHRVLDATEIWHYYGGAPLKLSLSHNDGKPVKQQLLGPDIFNNQLPQIIVEKGEWQRAESLGDWTLIGATVAPAFIYEVFEMAPPGWEPNGASASK